MRDGIAVKPGDVIASKYRVEKVLGKGQMGVIVAALHLQLDRRYAIKLVAGGRDGRAQRARFLREARAAVKLESQHVARVFDVGTLDDGAPYIVMELLTGRDLAAVLRERGRLPIADAVEYILQASEAIAEAHRAGIVHRDVKPANLYLTAGPGGEPCVKVLDFGLSKMIARDAGSGLSLTQLNLTQDEQLLGSPLYMSPEQLNTPRDVDARSDIWSLGVTLYQLCTGAFPFIAENLTGLTMAVFTKPPVPMSDHRPDAPAGFEEVVLACLEKDRDKRWANVADLAAALAPFAPPRARRYAKRVAHALGEQAVAERPSAEHWIEATETPSAPSAPAGASSQPEMAGSTGALTSVAPEALTSRRSAVWTIAFAVLGVAAIWLWGWRIAVKPSPSIASHVGPSSIAVRDQAVDAPSPTVSATAMTMTMPKTAATVETSSTTSPATVNPPASTSRPRSKLAAPASSSAVRTPTSSSAASSSSSTAPGLPSSSAITTSQDVYTR
jgi:serine/threonine-protein kinase